MGVARQTRLQTLTKKYCERPIFSDGEAAAALKDDDKI
jgi:hypothetical protein